MEELMKAIRELASHVAALNERLQLNNELLQQFIHEVRVSNRGRGHHEGVSR